MAKKITELTELTSYATNDLLIIEDVSANTTKKITWENLIADNSITPAKMALTVSAADANGWIKRDYGDWQTYERTFTTSGLSVPAQSNVSAVTFSTPVGLAGSASLRFTLGVLGGFGGRIFASLDNANVTTNVTSMSLHLGNLTSGSINFIGHVYVYAISV